MLKKVYIAGPFRGMSAREVEQNVKLAGATGFQVAKLGAIPVIPHTMYAGWDGTLTDEFWLTATMDLMLICDAVLMVGNWTASKGATTESSRAISEKIPVFADIKELALWLTR